MNIIIGFFFFAKILLIKQATTESKLFTNQFSCMSIFLIFPERQYFLEICMVDWDTNNVLSEGQHGWRVAQSN